MPSSSTKPTLQTELDLAVQYLFDTDVESPEYDTALSNVERIHKLMPDKKPVDRNTVITAVTNIVGILLITQHERANVITSKALSFVMKTR